MLDFSLLKSYQAGGLDRGFFEYPPRSPDLTPLDFFLWEYLQNNVYAMKPTTIAELRTTIERE